MTDKELLELAARAPFPAGCTIRNIRRGEGHRAKYVYASLYGPDGELLISATLDYINEQIVAAGTLPAPVGQITRAAAAIGKEMGDD